MDPTQHNAILNLLAGRIGESEFCELYGVNAEHVADEVAQLLELGRSTGFAEYVELAFVVASRFSVPESSLECVQSLVGATWHRSHEELIRLLQDWRNPGSVDALCIAIKLKPLFHYLEYDDYGAFYKKCLWALASIGTEDAFAAIKMHANSDIPALREQAAYRMGKLQRQDPFEPDRN